LRCKNPILDQSVTLGHNPYNSVTFGPVTYGFLEHFNNEETRKQSNWSYSVSLGPTWSYSVGIVFFHIHKKKFDIFIQSWSHSVLLGWYSFFIFTKNIQHFYSVSVWLGWYPFFIFTKNIQHFYSVLVSLGPTQSNLVQLDPTWSILAPSHAKKTHIHISR
jgi:hypothetical protein